MASFTTNNPLGLQGLVRYDGAEAQPPTDGVLGIYFSAHWCGPCRNFTPRLAEAYKELKLRGANFEVVFVSRDSDQKSFEAYFKSMPSWTAVSFDNTELKDALEAKFNVRGFPTLILLDATTGDVLTPNGREVVTTFGADGYPYTLERLTECKVKALELKNASLASLDLPKLLGPAFRGETAVDLEFHFGKAEALALGFFGEGQGSSVVLPKLAEATRKLNGRLETVVLDLGGTPEAGLMACKDVCTMCPDANVEAVVNELRKIVGDIEEPHVVVLANDGATLKLLSEDAARDVYMTGFEGFPWSEERKAELKAEADAKQREIATKQKNLEFLFTADRNTLPTNGDSESLTRAELTKEGTVTGLYFSAHWCGPCRGFTPKLAQHYEQCAAARKRLRIVFVSSDRDEEGFGEYFGTMPPVRQQFFLWAALPYAERELKTALSSLFEVQGIPTLVLLDHTGAEITRDGRAAVQFGPECFPYTTADIARCAAASAAKAREAETSWAAAQGGAGALVRLRGKPGACTLTHAGPLPEIEFGAFVTFAAPDMAASCGKLFYEVELLATSGGITQIGWANAAFERHDEPTGDGVGDCAASWGFDGQRCLRFHGSTSEPWGRSVGAGGVLGVAADLDAGEFRFGVDGVWDLPLGLAFDGVAANDAGGGIFPALTGQGFKVRVNLGKEKGQPFKHGPPDASYKAAASVLAGGGGAPAAA